MEAFWGELADPPEGLQILVEFWVAIDQGWSSSIAGSPDPWASDPVCEPWTEQGGR